MAKRAKTGKTKTKSGKTTAPAQKRSATASARKTGNTGARRTPVKTAPAKGAAPASQQKPILKKSPLTAKELEYFKNVLIVLRNKVISNVSFLTKENLKPIPINDEDTDGFDCEFALSIAGNEQELLHEIDEALQRIEDGTYGICQLTGTAIRKERLKALPHARYCLEAQSETEKNHFRRRRIELA